MKSTMYDMTTLADDYQNITGDATYDKFTGKVTMPCKQCNP